MKTSYYNFVRTADSLLKEWDSGRRHQDILKTRLEMMQQCEAPKMLVFVLQSLYNSTLTDSTINCFRDEYKKFRARYNAHIENSRLRNLLELSNDIVRHHVRGRNQNPDDPTTLSGTIDSVLKNYDGIDDFGKYQQLVRGYKKAVAALQEGKNPTKTLAKIKEIEAMLGIE